MYIAEKNLLFVEIPKNGTTTARTALEAIFGEQPLTGHVTESHALQWLKDNGKPVDQVFAVWRDPVERFLSAFLHVYAGEWHDLDDALLHALHTGRASQVIFKPQVYFLDGKHVDRTLFPFPPDEVLRVLGVDGDIPHANESKKRWTLDDVRYRIGEIRDFVRDDLEFEQRGLQVAKVTQPGKVDKRTRAYKEAVANGTLDVL